MRTVILLSLLVWVCPLTAFDGWYLGGSMGGGETQGLQTGKATGQVSIVANNTVMPVDLGVDLGSTSWVGALYTGYGKQWHCLYGGVEAFVQYSHENMSVVRQDLLYGTIDRYATSDTTSVCVGPWHYGVDFRPGFLLTPDTLFYGRVGVSWDSVKLRTTGSCSGFAGLDPADPTWAVSRTVSKSHLRPHLRLGGGIEQKVGVHWALRADYAYTDFGKISQTTTVSGLTTTLEEPTSFTDSKAISLHNHELQLGLSYYLCAVDCEPNPFLYTSYDPPSAFCGCYVAGALGANLTDARPTGAPIGVIYDTGAETTDAPVSLASHMKKTTFDGVFYAGYSLQGRRIALALEGFAQYSPYSRTHSDQTIWSNQTANSLYIVTAQTRAEVAPWQYGIAFRPGILLSPLTLLYGTIGTSVATLKMHSNASFLETAQVANTVSIHPSHRSTRACLRAGGGVEYILSSHLHLRADYIYTRYGKIHVNGSGVFILDASISQVIRDSTTVQLSSHAATLGLAWYL